MRGIVFTGGEGPEPEISRCLAKGADLIVAADSGLLAAEAAGLSPDWVVGDMDSLDDPRRLEKYPPDRVLPYPRDKDYTDTELACSLLWEQGCAEIWLIGGGGGRMDHLFALRSLFERERFPRRWITASEAVYCFQAPRALGTAVPAPGTGIAATGVAVPAPAVSGGLALTLKPGSLVSVFPLGPGPWKAVSRGLKWPLDRLNWDRGFFGVSNRAETGEFSILAEQGRFMVIIDEAVCRQ
jgi:thiamine pyrophosphokinase